MKKFIVSLLVCLMVVGVAQADLYWVGGASGNWYDGGTVHWSTSAGGAVGTNIPGIPPNAYTTQIGDAVTTTAAVTVDADVNNNSTLKLANVAGNNVTLTLNTNKTLYYWKATGQLLYFGLNGTATINQSAGTVRVGGVGYTNFTQGEVRIADGATGAGYYKLEGGLLDVDIFRKKAKTTTGSLSIKAGTLAVRNALYNLGTTDTTGDTFQLVAPSPTGTVTFAPGGVGIISAWSRGGGAANVEIGYSAGTNAVSENFDADGGTLEFDIASLSSYDKVQVFGDTTLNDCDIVVNAISGYVPQVGDYFDAIIVAYGTCTGSGGTAYDLRPDKGISGTGLTVLTANWVASFVKADGSAGDDILRLTYIPEPATIALLSLGLIAIRRKK